MTSEQVVITRRFGVHGMSSALKLRHAINNFIIEAAKIQVRRDEEHITALGQINEIHSAPPLDQEIHAACLMLSATTSLIEEMRKISTAGQPEEVDNASGL